MESVNSLRISAPPWWPLREGRDGKCEGRNEKCEFLARESVSSSPIVRIFGKGKCEFIANFSAIMVTSLPSISLSLSVSLSLSHQKYLTHNIGSASALPIIDRFYLRPAGGDPGLDHLQKYFFDSLCFLEWTWPFWNPWKTFHEKNVWFKQRKTRRKVVPSLTPFGAARAAVQLTG